MNVKPDDWVRFEQAGSVVLAIVLYVDASCKSYPYAPEAITDHGRVNIGRILECRSALESTSARGTP